MGHVMHGQEQQQIVHVTHGHEQQQTVHLMGGGVEQQHSSQVAHVTAWAPRCCHSHAWMDVAVHVT